jgi:hypothetical protein
MLKRTLTICLFSGFIFNVSIANAAKAPEHAAIAAKPMTAPVAVRPVVAPAPKPAVLQKSETHKTTVYTPKKTSPLIPLVPAHTVTTTTVAPAMELQPAPVHLHKNLKLKKAKNLHRYTCVDSRGQLLYFTDPVSAQECKNLGLKHLQKMHRSR